MNLYLGFCPDPAGAVLAALGEQGYPALLDDIPLHADGQLDAPALRDRLRTLRQGFTFRRVLVARPVWGAPTVAALRAALDLMAIGHTLAELPHEHVPTHELVRQATAAAPRAAPLLQGPTQRARALALLLAHKARCAA